MAIHQLSGNRRVFELDLDHERNRPTHQTKEG